MKKVFVGIAATVLAAAMCVSFAACGGTSAKDIKGEEVTAEQWDAAFEAFEKDDAKFTIEETTTYEMTITADMTAVGGEKSSGTLTQKNTITYVKNGAKQSMKGEADISSKGDYEFDVLVKNLGIGDGENGPKEGKTDVERYTEKTETGYVAYMKDNDGNWQKSETPYSGDLYPEYELDLVGDFDDYKYDETLKGYVDKDYTAETKSYTVYKFDKDGKLVAVYSYSNSGEGTAITNTSETSYIFSYDAKDITLPTVE